MNLDVKKAAADEARAFKEVATRKRQKSEQWKNRVKEQKKAKRIDKAAVEKSETRSEELAEKARQAESKATEILDTVYDLKAVNQHKKPNVDTHTPEELLDIIEAKRREIAEALAILSNQ